MTLIIVSLVGIAIIAGLGYYAWQLTQQVKAQEQKLIGEVNERHDRIIESIRVISSSYFDKQVELIEAAIRLKVLLDNLPMNEQEKQPYSVLEVIYNKVAHIPTHDNWKQLPRKQKRAFEKEMANVEAEYKDLFADAIKQLMKEPFKFDLSIKRS
jgi:metal-responsive CopG/Arc/MetJ family transcriptional regulator